MPIVKSNYNPPFLFKNGFFSTVYSGLIRKVSDSKFEHKRQRINLDDGDFLDLDWSFSNEKTDKLVIILHGLEGSTTRAYMAGSAKLFNLNGYDALRVNFRGCSGEDNLQYRSYHSGATADLDEVVNVVLNNYEYESLYLNGFSLGGNLILKYLGEDRSISSKIKGAVAISVPCYLEGSAKELISFKNFPYAIRFKRHLLKRLRLKQKQFPDKITSEEINKIKTLIDFDDVYTSKAHGFNNAQDYYHQSSSLQFLPKIKIPTLIINALNDSFLSPECYPIKEAENNPDLYLEMPQYGGHVGFYLKGGYYYNELRTLKFINKVAAGSINSFVNP